MTTIWLRSTAMAGQVRLAWSRVRNITCVNRHEFLEQLHEIFRPRAYFEIGIHTGQSLALSRAPSVAVDPDYWVSSEVCCDVHMVRRTSDDFFASEAPFAHLGRQTIDLAFIDGMHLFEFVLRDFINTERHATWSSVIVLDDMLPRNADEAARDQHTAEWAGDVYKLVPVLQSYRPDLQLLLADTAPTGVLVVVGLDPDNSVLSDSYDEIIDRFVVNDPQQVPRPVLDRTLALPPASVLAAPFWASMVRAREGACGYGPAALRAEVEGSLRLSERESIADWRPEVRAGAGGRGVRTRMLDGLFSMPGVRAAAANPGLRRLGAGVASCLPDRWRWDLRSRAHRRDTSTPPSLPAPTLSAPSLPAPSLPTPSEPKRSLDPVDR